MTMALLTVAGRAPLKEKQCCPFGLTGDLVQAKSASVQGAYDKTHRDSQPRWLYKFQELS